MAIADTLRSSTESALGTVTEAIADAGGLVLEATFAAATDEVVSSRKVRRTVLMLLVIGGIAGVVLWRRSRSKDSSRDLYADSRA